MQFCTEYLSIIYTEKICLLKKLGHIDKLYYNFLWWYSNSFKSKILRSLDSDMTLMHVYHWLHQSMFYIANMYTKYGFITVNVKEDLLSVVEMAVTSAW